jgi:mannose-6-phosphate isomerase-like protein (cupin superfamily)
MKKFEVAQLDAIEPKRCPCGWTQRAFAGSLTSPASVHRVEIQEDAKTHYHRGFTEIYVVLEGEGYLELDGEQVPLKPMSAVQIQPGCRHRAIGRLTILNVAVPRFDPEDEWFD